MKAVSPCDDPSIFRRIFTVLAGIALAAWLPAIEASAAETDLDLDLPKASVWSGKSPFDLQPGFYDNPVLRQEARVLIGAKRYRDVMLGWSVASPIVTDGDALLASGCKPNDCGDNHQSTLIDRGSVAICIAERGTATWYAASLAKPVTRRIRGSNGVGCQFETVQAARASLASVR